MKNGIFNAIKRVTRSPILNVCVGLIFLSTGLYEIYDTAVSEVGDASIGAHHGAVLFGLLHALKFTPDLFEGLEYIQNARDEA